MGESLVQRLPTARNPPQLTEPAPRNSRNTFRARKTVEHDSADFHEFSNRPFRKQWFIVRLFQLSFSLCPRGGLPL